MLSLLICLLIPSVFSAAVSNLPVVDLGYGLWQATVNSTGQYYNFSNIRYAQPPVGDLRFALPQKPATNRTLNDGQDGRICPQATLAYESLRDEFVEAYLLHPNDLSSFADATISPAYPEGQSDGRATEDCLFLDVLVPDGVYGNSSLNATGGAPVLVYIYGGGFADGYKGSQGDPSGLIQRSMTDSRSAPGIVLVQMNYRLGALGWSSGPSFVNAGGVANAGLYDQRLALEWVQEHISKFGGDPNRVTIMGESAGASSSLHHITAFGGNDTAPFQQVILQSPAFKPTPYPSEQEELFQIFLDIANVTDLAGLRALSSEEIIWANEWNGIAAPYGQYNAGPVVDGLYAPELPSMLLAQGRYSKNIQAVFPAHNADEGLVFTNPTVQSDAAFETYLANSGLGSLAATLDKVADLYSPPTDQTNSTAISFGYVYNSTTGRLASLVGEWAVDCNVKALVDAFGADKTYSYLFKEGGALHGEDLTYTWYNDGPTSDPEYVGNINATVAIALQDWVIGFVATGNPNGGSAPSIPVYGDMSTVGLLSNDGLGTSVTDPTNTTRCDYWRTGVWI